MTQPSAGPAPISIGGGKQFSKGGAAASQVLSHPAVQAVVDAIEQYIGGYEMNDVISQDDFLNGLSELLERAGTVCTDLGDQWTSETPLDGEIIEYLHDLGADFTNMAQTGSDLYERWHAAHEPDIDRARNPRAGEEKLDVQAPGA